MGNSSISIIGTDSFLSTSDANYVKVNERWGKTHTIEAVDGVEPLLITLKPNQCVCWGDGATYHFRLTEK